MNAFLYGHATHPDPLVALAMAAAQIEVQQRGAGAPPTLGWVYFTDPFAPHAEMLLAALRKRWPGVHWVGASGVAIAAGAAEYVDEPALALMLGALPTDRFRVFSGVAPLGDFDAHTAQVHADPATHDIGGLVRDMSERTATGYLFGGLASGHARTAHIADGVFSGGLSGVAFDAGVALVSRVTQGCQPVGRTRSVTASEGNVVTGLDGEPALDCLLRDLVLEGVEPRVALPKLRGILVGLSDPLVADDGREDSTTRSAFDRIGDRAAFGADVRVRHLIGLDPGRRGIAIGDTVEPGTTLAFCSRNVDAARRDLMRICAELREELEPEVSPLAELLAARQQRPHGASDDDVPMPMSMPTAAMASSIAGAVYVSCTARGGAHFGAPSAELAIIRHALGDVPLVGFFAAGEIARASVYGYTGVLTVFRQTTP